MILLSTKNTTEEKFCQLFVKILIVLGNSKNCKRNLVRGKGNKSRTY